MSRRRALFYPGDTQGYYPELVRVEARLRESLPRLPSGVLRVAADCLRNGEEMLEAPQVLASLRHDGRGLGAKQKAELTSFRESWAQWAEGHLETLRHVERSATEPGF